MSKHALITGITGQDGSYLAELLLEKGYEVYGLMRRKSVVDYGNVDHIKEKIHFIYADMTDEISLIRAMQISQADEVYNLAAQSFVATSWEQPMATAEIDALGVTKMLEAMACGTPVLTTRAASLPEVVGDAAVIVDPHHTEDIAQGLEKLFLDAALRERLQKEGLRRAAMFSWENAAAALYDVYQEALTR